MLGAQTALAGQTAPNLLLKKRKSTALPAGVDVGTMTRSGWCSFNRLQSEVWRVSEFQSYSVSEKLSHRRAYSTLQNNKYCFFYLRLPILLFVLRPVECTRNRLQHHSVLFAVFPIHKYFSLQDSFGRQTFHLILLGNIFFEKFFDTF